MKIFKPYTLNWWQLGILKVALLSMGAIMGAYWHEFFNDNVFAIIIITVIATSYSMYIYFKN